MQFEHIFFVFSHNFSFFFHNFSYVFFFSLHLRKVKLSRGGAEGNQAFVKDMEAEDNYVQPRMKLLDFSRFGPGGKGEERERERERKKKNI